MELAFLRGVGVDLGESGSGCDKMGGRANVSKIVQNVGRVGIQPIRLDGE